MSNRRLAKNISTMSIAVFISRILGLIRDQVMAYYFGMTFLNDAFNVAYNIPNLLRRLFGEGALSSSFVPIYKEIGLKGNLNEQIDFAKKVLSLLTILLLFLVFIGILFSSFIVRIVYPGLVSQTFELSVILLKIIFPYMFFIGISSTMIAILNAHERFFMTGLSSALLNIGMVASIIIPASVWHIKGTALLIYAGWGVFLGGFLQTVVNFPYLNRPQKRLHEEPLY